MASRALTKGGESQRTKLRRRGSPRPTDDDAGVVRREARRQHLEDAVAFNDPESSTLTDDEALWLHVRHGVDELGRAIRTRGLNRAERNLLQLLYEELSITRGDDLDRRFFRAVAVVDETVGQWREVKTQRAREHTVMRLLVKIEGFRFDVHNHWTQHRSECAKILDRCIIGARPKGAIGPAGVLGRILFRAKWSERGASESGLVKRINAAVARETKRRG